MFLFIFYLLVIFNKFTVYFNGYLIDPDKKFVLILSSKFDEEN